MVTVTLSMAAFDRGEGASASPVELRAPPGEDLGAEKLDRVQERGVRHAADVHLQYLTAVAEQLVQGEDALGNLFRSAGEHHAARLGVVGAGGRRRAAPGTADLSHALAHHAELAVQVLSLRTAGLLADEAVDRDSDVGVLSGMAQLLP